MIVGHLSGWPATQVARSPEEARALVDSLHAVGAPFLKIMSGLSLGTYGAISERARSLGIPFVGHVAMDVRAADASDAGQHSTEHLLGLVEGCSSEEAAIIARYGVAAIFPEGEYDEARYLERIERALATQDDDRCRALAARFVENDTWQVPTLVTLRGLVSRHERTGGDDPRLRYLSASQLRDLGWFSAADTTLPGRKRARIRRAEFARQKEIVGMLAAARVPFLAGTDAPEPGAFPGFGLHDELGLLVEAGLTPLQALQSATLNPARFLGRTDDLGTVEAGKLADLVLLDANPLEDITHTRRVHGVVANGRYFDRTALDALLEQARSGAAR